MPTGTVKWYKADAGFGTISTDNGGPDLFVHHTRITGTGFRFLLAGEPVEFDVGEDPKKGSVAVNVRPPSSRLNGRVENFDHQKGFGTIKRSDSGELVFFHFKNILSTGQGRTTAEPGEEVQFTLGTRKTGALQALLVKRADSRAPLLRFADMGDDRKWLDLLSGKAEPENWNHSVSSGSNRYKPVLYSYIVHTFARLEQEDAGATGKKIAMGRAGASPYACFNTGLVTKHQEEIFALFSGKTPGQDGRKWRLAGFHAESDHAMLGKFERLPEIANYFDDASVLLYDRSCELYIDVEHIIQDNIKRFPEELRSKEHLARNSLHAARVQTGKRVNRNYKAAVPQFHRGAVQLLLPLCLVEPARADLALVVTKHDRQYRGETVLTLDMAYNNARLICRPDSDWLKA
ncbi:DUF3825 domain-containing protein [Arthrobacter sp. SAFR-179]|uniref:DUF3825 domain-containing protein n=1 Tax=Arthrobacter sp. SAFR-179 TaxID=3387279 RepID=UPI003F7B567A